MDPDDMDYDAVIRKNVARTTASSIEMLLLYLETELRRIRFFLRDSGGRLRRFLAESVRIDFRSVVEFLSTLTNTRVRHVTMDTSVLNGDEAMIFNTIPLRSRWKPPKYTFNDIAAVLTMDPEVEDGVVHAYMIRSPAWSCLPSPIASQCEPESLDFQLFNHPLQKAFTMDDEDDRLSLPSTLLTDQDLKIQSLEAQLALLSKQMQSLLAGKIPPVPPVACNIDICSPLSDDEGRGASLGSPSETTKMIIPREEKQTCALPKLCLPAGVPPPPPPPPHFLSLPTDSTSVPKWQTLKTKPDALQMLKKSSNLEHDALPVRPSVNDLRTVQLKKTNTIRSPGGTPITRTSSQPAIEDNYLANALREKFRSVQDYMSEHEEDVSTSWIEDEL